MRNATLISLLAVLLCSCNAELTRPVAGNGWLCIEDITVSGHSVMGTKGAVDDDFVVEISDSEGKAVQSFSAGNVPSKVALPAGDYKLTAYSTNVGDWKSAADGVGAAAYRGETDFTIEAEMYAYVKIVAPMANCAVRFVIEDDLSQWFTTFSISAEGGGGRNLTLSENITGWFEEGKLSFHLNATNTDGDSFEGYGYSFTARKGHLYTLKYKLSPAEVQTGGTDLDITIDDEFVDDEEEIDID